MVTSRPLTDGDGRPFVHIYQVVETRTGKAPVERFFEHLAASEQMDLMARFEKLDDAPFFESSVWEPMGQWFKPIGRCWEVGNDDRVRFYGFRDRNRLVLAVGCKKRGKKTPADKVAECERLESEYRAPNGRGGA